MNSSEKPKSEKEFQNETQELTTLFEQQVNHWHRQKPLSEDQIAAVQKITKLALLNRNMSGLTFVNVLDKGQAPLRFFALSCRKMFRSRHNLPCCTNNVSQYTCHRDSFSKTQAPTSGNIRPRAHCPASTILRGIISRTRSLCTRSMVVNLI